MVWLFIYLKNYRGRSTIGELTLFKLVTLWPRTSNLLAFSYFYDVMKTGVITQHMFLYFLKLCKGMWMTPIKGTHVYFNNCSFHLLVF